MQEAPVKVLLVGVDIGEEADFEHSMEELASLAEAAEKEVVGQIVQRLDHVNKALYIGTGKVAEVRRLAEERGAQEVVFDNSLTPSQVRNLGKELELTVIDRTNLILDIFAIRAQTREAKLQVETARLQYMLPRLVGMYDALSRQGGASGSMSNKGTGEKKLELDRRKIEHRITELKKELEDVSRTRDAQEKTAVPDSAGGAGGLYQCGKVYDPESYGGAVRRAPGEDSHGKRYAVRHIGDQRPQYRYGA